MNFKRTINALIKFSTFFCVFFNRKEKIVLKKSFEKAKKANNPIMQRSIKAKKSSFHCVLKVKSTR